MFKSNIKTIAIFFFGVAVVLITILHWNSYQGKANGQTAENSLVIYDDQLQSNFINWSWNSNSNFSDNANAQSGNAISFTLTGGWAGLYLHTDNEIDIVSYKELTFSIKAAQDGQKYAVAVYDTNNQLTTNPVSLDNYGGQPGRDWKTYTISLGDLNVSGKKIKGVGLNEITGVSNGTIYVDNIRLNGTVEKPTEVPTTSTMTPTPTDVQITSAPTTTPAVVSAPAPQQTYTASGNPLAGATLFNDSSANPAAKQVQEWQASRPGDAAMIKKIADQPKATWLGNWTANIQNDTKTKVDAASASNAMPVFIAYNIPGRDCGSYSAGGSGNAQAYKDWINGMASGISNRRAIIVLEPDALAHDCLQGAVKQERYDLLKYAIQKLKSLSGTAVYLDAGHSSWVPATDMANRLKEAGVAAADGFAVNVSNFQTTSSSISYGEQVSTQLGGKHFIVDTARNGNGPAPDNAWCNPAGRALGEKPTTSTGYPLIDGFLWLKYPGESDGNCNGAPSAGQWYPDYALDLAKNAKW